MNVHKRSDLNQTRKQSFTFNIYSFNTAGNSIKNQRTNENCKQRPYFPRKLCWSKIPIIFTALFDHATNFILYSLFSRDSTLLHHPGVGQTRSLVSEALIILACFWWFKQKLECLEIWKKLRDKIKNFCAWCPKVNSNHDRSELDYIPVD